MIRTLVFAFGVLLLFASTAQICKVLSAIIIYHSGTSSDIASAICEAYYVLQDVVGVLLDI